MQRRTRLPFFAVVVAALITFSGCDWAQFRNGPDRTGYTTTQVAEFAGIPGLIEKWTGTTGGAVRSSPVIAAGTVYVGSADARLYAYDAATGALRWQHTTGRRDRRLARGRRNSSTSARRDTTLYALNTADGTIQWSRVIDANFGRRTRPRLQSSGGRVFVVSGGTVHALHDGRRLRPVAGARVRSRPAVGPGRQRRTWCSSRSYGTGTVTALHVEDGSVAWSTTVPGTYAACPDAIPCPRRLGRGRVCRAVPGGCGSAVAVRLRHRNRRRSVWSVGDGAYTTSPAVANGIRLRRSAANQTFEARRTSDGGARSGPGRSVAVRSPRPPSRQTSCSSGPMTGPCGLRRERSDAMRRNDRARVQPTVDGRDRRPGAFVAGCRRRLRLRRLGRRVAARVRHPADRVLEEPAAVSGLAQPTVARFGPDHRLYVAQYTGSIKVLTLARNRQTPTSHEHRDDQSRAEHSEPR